MQQPLILPSDHSQKAALLRLVQDKSSELDSARFTIDILQKQLNELLRNIQPLQEKIENLEYSNKALKSDVDFLTIKHSSEKNLNAQLKIDSTNYERLKVAYKEILQKNKVTAVENEEKSKILEQCKAKKDALQSELYHERKQRLALKEKLEDLAKERIVKTTEKSALHIYSLLYTNQFEQLFTNTLNNVNKDNIQVEVRSKKSYTEYEAVSFIFNNRNLYCIYKSVGSNKTIFLEKLSKLLSTVITKFGPILLLKLIKRKLSKSICINKSFKLNLFMTAAQALIVRHIKMSTQTSLTKFTTKLRSLITKICYCLFYKQSKILRRFVQETHIYVNYSVRGCLVQKSIDKELISVSQGTATALNLLNLIKRFYYELDVKSKEFYFVLRCLCALIDSRSIKNFELLNILTKQNKCNILERYELLILALIKARSKCTFQVFAQLVKAAQAHPKIELFRDDLQAWVKNFIALMKHKSKTKLERWLPLNPWVIQILG